MTSPLYLPISKAAQVAGTNKARLNEWIADGLPVYRPPGKTALVRIEDLDEYIQKYRIDTVQTKDIVDSILRLA